MAGDYRELVVSDDKKRLVEGFANVAVLDRQGDLVPAEAMSKAMLDYMAHGGIILLAHENKPVGKVLQWDVQTPAGSTEPGVHIIAEIHNDTGIGDQAWSMLKEKLLTGFSIGGVAKDTEKIRDKSAVGGMARVLSEIQLNEISLVQIPANQMATVDAISLAKGVKAECWVCFEMTNSTDEYGNPCHAHCFDFAYKEMRHEEHKYATSKVEAEKVAQQLKHDGKVVYGVQQEGKDWCISYGQRVNRANTQTTNEKVHGTEKDVANLDEVYRPDKVEDISDKAEDSGGSPTPSVQMEQDGNFDAPKYSVTPQKDGAPVAMDGAMCACGHGQAQHNPECMNCECKTYAIGKEAVSSATAGAANVRYGPDFDKPVQSRDQWGWLAVHRPDLLHQWQGEHPVKYRGLPEHKALYGKPKKENPDGKAEERQEDVGGGCAFCEREDHLIEDIYGFEMCVDCNKAFLEYGKAASTDPVREHYKCGHCGSEMQAPKMSAPNQVDYMWCPTCQQHRHIPSKDVQPIETQKNPRDGATADENVGQNGLGNEHGMQMSLTKEIVIPQFSKEQTERVWQMLHKYGGIPAGSQIVSRKPENRPSQLVPEKPVLPEEQRRAVKPQQYKSLVRKLRKLRGK